MFSSLLFGLLRAAGPKAGPGHARSDCMCRHQFLSELAGLVAA